MKDQAGNKACCMTCRHAIKGKIGKELCELLQKAIDSEDAPSVSWWFVCEHWKERL